MVNVLNFIYNLTLSDLYSYMFMPSTTTSLKTSGHFDLSKIPKDFIALAPPGLAVDSSKFFLFLSATF